MEREAARAPLPAAPRPNSDRAAGPRGSLPPGLGAEQPMAAPPGPPCGRSQPRRAQRQAPEPTRDARSQRRVAPPSSPPNAPASAAAEKARQARTLADQKRRPHEAAPSAA